MEKLNYEVGDIVKLKKSHPCGSSQWEILRVGADFRLKCMGCGHQIMVAAGREKYQRFDKKYLHLARSSARMVFRDI